MLDGGPSRVGRLTGRRSAYRSEPAQQSEEQPTEATPERVIMDPQPVTPSPRQRSESAASRRQASGSSWRNSLIGLLVLAIIAFACFMVWNIQSSSEDDMIEADKYQAVFLSNGQIYFGKLSSHGDRYMKLTNVYYLERQIEAQDNTESELPSSSDNSFQLLKYSDVLYGSEDLMMISRDDIVRYENLSPNGVVGRAIAERN